MRRTHDRKEEVQLIIVGTGGFGREVLDVVEAGGVATPYETVAFMADFDDNDALLAQRGYERIGPIQASTCEPCDYVIGIGSGEARRVISKRLDVAGFRAVTLVHPTSSVGAGVTVGPGTVICGGARLTNNITLGRHVHVNLNATIGHDCVLEDFVTLSPLVAISGRCTLAEGVTMGTTSCTIERRTIGAWTTVGAGGVVTKDLEQGVVAVGAPARPRVAR